MPEISRFYGVIITMFFEDHNPPHFHVRYGSHDAVVRIKDLVLMEGSLPPRAVGLVMEWAGMHQNELLRDWELATQNKPLLPIEPLE